MVEQAAHSSDKLQTWGIMCLTSCRPLERFYETCDTVVLAFDNYELVPPAKCMTQQKRRRNIPVLTFSDRVLPSHVPQNEQWMACIANRLGLLYLLLFCLNILNRTFKSMVIEFVILTLPTRLLKDKPERKLIIRLPEA